MDWETARRWLEIMAKNVFDPNQPAYIVVLQRVEELERKNARVEKALALHQPVTECRDRYDIAVCHADGADWPCPTRRALDGEE